MATRDPRQRFDWRNLAIAVAIPAVFFALLELGLGLAGVEPTLYEEDPYVGFATRVPLYIPADEPGTLITAPNKRRLFNQQSFAAEKPRDGFRIFCVGGSTTYGRPYDDRTSYCGWLRELLPAVDPSRRWEVINAGGVSYASYRTALLMEELVEYEPDLFIIYSGHNEFLERRTYSGLIAMPRAVRGLGAVASRTHLYSALRSAARILGRAEGNEGQAPRSQLSAEVKTLLDGSIGPDEYRRDDALRRQVLDHYRFNLARMVDIGSSVGARSLLITPASSLRDCAPFKSEASAGVDETTVEERLRTAAAARDAGRAADALFAVDEALDLDPRYAHSHYLRGEILDVLGRHGDARAAYRKARDEDICPLRALEPVASIVEEVAAEREVRVVDFAGWAARNARDGIPGADLFLDHVHPTIDVHRQLALLLVDALADAGVVEKRADATARLAEVRRRVERGVDRLAHGVALLNLSKVLGWAGKLDEARRLAERAAETAPELAEAHYQAGVTSQLTERLDAAIAHYRSSLELAPNAATTHGNLAAALEENGNVLQAILHYRRAVALLGEGESPYKTQLVETLARLGATAD